MFKFPDERLFDIRHRKCDTRVCVVKCPQLNTTNITNIKHGMTQNCVQENCNKNISIIDALRIYMKTHTHGCKHKEESKKNKTRWAK